MLKLCKVFNTIVLFAFALALSAHAEPDIFTLRADRPVWDLANEDVNTDGFADILALTATTDPATPEKYLDLFVSNTRGQYPSKPTHTLQLPPETGVMFLAEIDGAPPREFVAGHGRGAIAYRFTASGIQKIESATFNSLLPSQVKEPLFLKDAALDLTGDQIDEWLIPVPAGYEVRNLNKQLAFIPCDVVSEIKRNNDLYISHRLPAYHAFDVDGTENKGLAFLSDESADFAYGDQWQEHRQFKIPTVLKEKWEASTHMEDVNQDGFPDLMITQTKGTINMEVQTRIYLATAPFTYPDEPTAQFVRKGAASFPMFLDFNGDENLDVIFVSASLGVKNIINMLLRRKVTVVAEGYRYTGNGFDKKAAFSSDLVFDMPDGREQVAQTAGDFNGDGRPDMAFGKGKDQLIIHIGQPKDVLTFKPWITLDVPGFGVASQHDLNGNKKSDILLYHPASENSNQIEVIIF